MEKNVPRVFYHPGHVFHAIGIQNVQSWIFTVTKLELFVYLENDCLCPVVSIWRWTEINRPSQRIPNNLNLNNFYFPFGKGLLYMYALRVIPKVRIYFGMTSGPATLPKRKKEIEP